MNTVTDVCKFITNLISEYPICIETGSTYCIEKPNLIHTTTNNIANIICKEKNGTLYSLDINETHQKLAASVCDKDIDVKFILGDSVSSLEILCHSLSLESKQVNLLWLDSKEFDADHMIKEFMAIKPVLAGKHFILVDDVHNPRSVKWIKMVPMLKDLKYCYFEVKTPVGLFVAYTGYNLER